MAPRKRLSTTLLWNMVAVAASAIALLGYLWVSGEYARFDEEEARLRADTVEARKALVAQEVERTLNFVDFKRSQTEERVKDGLRARVREAHAVATHLWRTYRGRVPDRELRSLVREALRPLRFNAGRGYFFATSLDGVEQLFADRPEMEGKNLLGLRDTRGAYVIRDMISLARNRGGGFYAYTWTRPEREGKDFRKLSYVKLFEPFGWFLGTGEYVDDMNGEIQRETLERIEQLRIEPEGRIFVGRWDGTWLTSPSRAREDPALSEDRRRGFVRELIRVARGGGGFVAAGPGAAIAYCRAVEDWRWFVGADVYLDDVYRQIEENRLRLRSRVRWHVVKIAGLLLGTLLGAVWLSGRVVVRTRREMEAFTSFFRRAAAESAELDPAALRFEEFRGLAESANRMLAERRRTADLYLLLAENVSDVLWTADRRLRWTYVSASAARLLGYPVDRLMSLRPRDLLPISYWPAVRQVGESLWAGNQPEGSPAHGSATLEYPLRRADGSLVWVESRVSVIRGADGQPEGFLGVTRDVSSRREAQEQLRRRSEDLAERVKELRCLYSVSKSLGRGGRSTEETLAEVANLIPPGWREPGLTWARVSIPGQISCSEGFRETPWRLVSPIAVDGESVGTVEVFSAEGVPAGDEEPFLREETHLVDEIAQRIGELIGRKRIEAELREAKERAELANRMKSTFLANVSHELRTPMNSILGYTELLLDGVEGELDPGPRESLGRVERNARHLLHLIDELLDLSRIESDRLELDCVVFSVRALLGDVAQTLEALAGQRDVRLTVAVPPDVPDLVVGDESHLKQVLVNLGGNAVKFTERGEVNLGVQGERRESGAVQLRFSVRDTGIGIPVDQQESIFEAFVQGDPSSTRRHGGVGLGLAISARLVERMGGSIGVESEPGRGSTFYFTVPCGVAEEG